ncbi:type II toxin-antitoxin system RelE/ParE family toxin [Sphingomonas agrestis]|uniref:type II toxin-antitoxin system RelE/ParE family toxin n=1 Tax=Sphingomonas agrestis TaxID=3080540 RepID=UPI00374DD4A5
MRPVIWSEASLRDLAEIDAFLDERDSRIASQMLRAVRTAVARLQEYPQNGWHVRGEFRVFKVAQTPYRVVYRVAAENLEIARIRHVRENWR